MFSCQFTGSLLSLKYRCQYLVSKFQDWIIFNTEVKIFNHFHETEVFSKLKSFHICDFKIFMKNYLTLWSKYLNFITHRPHLKNSLFALTQPTRKKRSTNSNSCFFVLKTNVLFLFMDISSHEVFYSTFEHTFNFFFKSLPTYHGLSLGKLTYCWPYTKNYNAYFYFISNILLIWRNVIY